MNTEIIDILKNGGVVVMPTDTIYGIVGSVLNSETVERIYQLRKRNLDKPFIILISSINDLEKFDVKLTKKQREFLKKYWPNPLSIVLPVVDKKWKYLHRGTKTLAFRMPKDEKLLEVLKEVGPLVAPSANSEGEKPSETIDEAKKYFGGSVLCYIDGGKIISKPSTLIELNNDGSYKILRAGEFKL